MLAAAPRRRSASQEMAGSAGIESDSFERQRNALTTAYAECDHAAADAFTAHGVQ